MKDVEVVEVGEKYTVVRTIEQQGKRGKRPKLSCDRCKATTDKHDLFVHNLDGQTAWVCRDCKKAIRRKTETMSPEQLEERLRAIMDSQPKASQD